MTDNSESRYIRLEVIGGKNLKVSSGRIPAGIYVSIDVNFRRCWKSAIGVLLSDASVVWGDMVILSSHASVVLSLEIRASYELGRMLGSGKVIGKIQTSWDELLDHGDEPFDLFFPPVHDVHPSLTLKAAVLHTCDDQDRTIFDTLVDCEIARDTDVGHARLAEYMTSGTVSHLNDAVQHFQLVLDKCPVGHPDHAAALTNLAYARLEGYTQNHFQGIDTTTSFFREALALRPQGHPDHASSLYNLIRALIWRHSKVSTAVYIHESAQLCCKLLPHCPEGTYLRSVGVDSAVGYVTNNSLPIDASDEGIHLRRNILEICPTNAFTFVVKPLPCGPRDILAASIVTLTEAISLHEESLRLRPVGHESRDFSLDNLGGALVTRFNKSSNIDDITRAISLRREALTLRPPGHPSHEDLNEAIDRYRESLRLRQLSDPKRHAALCNLSSVLCSRFMLTLEYEDVKEAINLCQESLEALPSLHPERYYSYVRLREAYLSRYRILYYPADLSLAMENFRLASRHPTQGFPGRLVDAYNWTVTAETYNHDSALEAYTTFFELLDGHLVTRSSTISRREAAAAFRDISRLPVDAASCAIRRNNLRHAVELVEQGRGQQWSLASRFKTSVEDLESANPTLAFNYLELSKRVSNAAQSSATITDRAAADLAETKYRKLTRQWEAAVAEIRDLRAFSRFLLPPAYEDLQTAARHGPVIILIASQYSCSAIVVPTSGEPLSCSLAVYHPRRSDDSQRSLHPGNTTRVSDEPKGDKNRFDSTLANSMGGDHATHRQPFTSIPLHAANPFLTKADRSKEPCLEDLYICSYTPTLSALVRSRQLMKKRVAPSFVAIGQGQPGAGKGKALLAVDSELELVHTLVPATANRTTVSGGAATRAGALQALEESTWVHLACHGKQDPRQPYNSHFVMRDEHLTLLDIMDKDIPHAEFAFLSACHTAVGDKETPDEVIHLAAGLQFSGFKSVIGTLWEVDDAVAKYVVEAFYKYMFHPKEDGVMDCTKAAWALNCATHAVKTKVPLEQRMVFHSYRCVVLAVLRSPDLRCCVLPSRRLTHPDSPLLLRVQRLDQAAAVNAGPVRGQINLSSIRVHVFVKER
ncbi:CHAT domain-containing protein [Suillus occidentalis]|nr:CHAT domain-containing protein [Suillus occidentalis]